MTRSVSEIFRQSLETLDRPPHLRRRPLGVVEEMVLDMVEDQQLLDLLQRLLDRLELLDDIRHVPPCLHHADHCAEMSLGTAQPLDDIGIKGVAHDSYPIQGDRICKALATHRPAPWAVR
ncbi:hypothetical protein BOSEA31B_14687 [Hyphomicrobiales bacterium]|nr:hypothetical protein BOSEA31B_14687 [Hyphomicrobiales bacterium]CAH1701178.1 hypothetical protein BOSEA1005_20877 [Hyphomicrobiales bacterium]